MTKFTIDFTAAEKRKLWKAKISLRRLDDCSLNQIFEALKPNEIRKKEIRRQFYEYGTSDNLSTGLASIMGVKPFGMDLVNGSMLGMSKGVKTALDLMNNRNGLYANQTQRMLDLVNKSSLDFGKSQSIAMRMVEIVGKSPDFRLPTHALKLARSSASVMDAFKPISERLMVFTPAMERLRKETNPFTITGLAAFSKDLNSFDKLTGSVSAIISKSLLQQESFKRLDIASLTKQIALNTTFERTHISGIGSALAAATSFTDLARTTLGTFAWESVGSRNKLADALVQSAQHKFLNLSADYSSLLRNINEKPNWIYEAPDTAKLPAQDYYVGAKILKIVSTEDDVTEVADTEIGAENTDAISRYLPIIHSDLPDLWEGALQSLHSDNPDKIRHMITSIRELYTHVLHLLAPDAEMKRWDPEQKHYDNGRPTRKGRFMYICRNLEGSTDKFAKLLKSEIDATIAMIDLFQGGTHTIKSSYSPNELQFIRIKAETTLRTFLSLEFDINRK